MYHTHTYLCICMETSRPSIEIPSDKHHKSYHPHSTPHLILYAKSKLKNKRMMKICLVVLVALISVVLTTSFVVVVTPARSASSTNELYAKKNTAKSKAGGSGGGGGGFGVAALEPCPCGSSESYSRCCGKLHKDVNAYKSAKAEQVARARYSAYAKKQADFLMATTHPLHKDFNTDLKQWKEQIK